MITAKEAREKMRTVNKSKQYLTTLNTNIKIAAGGGRDRLTLCWNEKINRETFIEVTQTLLDNGYTVKTIPAADHYSEYGAIEVKW